MPKGAERRMVLRLLTYWRGLRSDRAFPAFADLDPTAIADIWKYCFILDLAGHETDPVFRAAGTAFSGYADCSFEALTVSGAPRDTIVERSTHFFRDVVENRAPVSRGGELTRRDGVRVLYRCILLPMSEDGQAISGFLGGANSRDVAVEIEGDGGSGPAERAIRRTRDEVV